MSKSMLVSPIITPALWLTTCWVASKHTHDDIPCVCHNEDGKGAFENPAEEHGAVEVVHIVLFHNHVNQLIAHHKGENGRRNGDDHRFGQVLQHGKNAAVPVLRGTAHIRRDFPDFGINCVKQAGTSCP